MNDKILDKISKIGEQLDGLATKKQELIKELKQIDLDIQVLSTVAFELKDLLDQDGESL